MVVVLMLWSLMLCWMFFFAPPPYIVYLVYIYQSGRKYKPDLRIGRKYKPDLRIAKVVL